MDFHAHSPYSTPLFLSPALPSDLLQFIINRCTYPTTLVICADRAEFLSALSQDLLSQRQEPPSADEPHDTAAEQATTDLPNLDPTPEEEHPPHAIIPLPAAADRPPRPPPPAQPKSHNASSSSSSSHNRPHPLLTPSLAQLSTTRHIRTVFVPTVSHLRAFLSVFSLDSSSTTSSSSGNNNKVPVPPPPPPQPPSLPPADPRSGTRLPPLLVAYDFLALHRNTSEWSAQGLGATSAALAEAGRRAGLGVVVVEGLSGRPARGAGQEGDGGGNGDDAGARQGTVSELRGVLGERVPVLSGRGFGGDSEGRSGWVGKTVDLGRVLGRWFRFREGEWTAGGG